MFLKSGCISLFRIGEVVSFLRHIHIYSVRYKSRSQFAHTMKTAENTTKKIIWKYKTYKNHRNRVTKQYKFKTCVQNARQPYSHKFDTMNVETNVPKRSFVMDFLNLCINCLIQCGFIQ